MPANLFLANGKSITREEALDRKINVVAQFTQYKAVADLKRVWDHQDDWCTLVAAHVGVQPGRIQMSHPPAWKRGTFNLVVPMLLKGDGVPPQVLLRVPMPAKIGEKQHQGSVADKLRCEAASYIWMQRHCPDIRIPHLYGFGIPGVDGGHFTHASRLPILRRALLYVRQCTASILHRPVPSDYLPIAAPPQKSTEPPLADTGYLLLENLDEVRFGKQIPYVLPRGRSLHELYAEEPEKTANLCRGLARVMLALARVPQPRIGAFRFSPADGTILLDGRPTTCSMAILESEGAQRRIGLDTTYACVDRYVADMLGFRASVFCDDPNAAVDAEEAKAQMADLVFLRAVTHHFVSGYYGRDDRDDRNGPFVLHLSDDNAGNVLVDDDWHVTGLFDLEWLFAAPVGALSAPWWLTWQAVDDVAKPGSAGYDAYCASRRIFMDILRDEEEKVNDKTTTAPLAPLAPLSAALDASWDSERTWLYVALTSVDALGHVVRRRLRPLFVGAGGSADSTCYAALYELWSTSAAAVVAQKLRDREQYEAVIERLFADEYGQDCSG
ncbi:hypothetical protein SCUCBS95973_000668 [Sporothrix curviconia]|uniref:Aminoglycoside phosphotransferase domain-containing protein n=1 Tax=Sporothrix curviconia TaxID=1260050 RepID=A0ABP0AS22_9PEZI